MGGRNIFPQNHMWAQYCLIRDSSQLVFTQQRVVGRMRGGTVVASSASAQLVPGLPGGRIQPENQRFPWERNKGLKSSHDLDGPSGGHTFILGMARMAVSFVRNSGVGSHGFWEERLGGGELCCAEGSRLCFMGSSHLPGDSPHPAVPAKGQFVHPLLPADPLRCCE